MSSSAAQITKNPLHGGDVSIAWCVKVKTKLLDRICDVGPSESKVLQCAHNGSVHGGI